MGESSTRADNNRLVEDMFVHRTTRLERIVLPQPLVRKNRNRPVPIGVGLGEKNLHKDYHPEQEEELEPWRVAFRI